MGEFTVKKLKEIGTTKESIKEFKKYKQKQNKSLAKKKENLLRNTLVRGS